ncbi:DNA-formamidopyrimidine glycosylase family protein [Ornithinimicrobium sufpigmenti]|uniref:DNA-formamidopyrimidine glycosylase family protein n=1 Tax=Ornithinimicrobium sufpigmenti TaxID=2508882 RepID=UPI001036ADA0|nr:MULTISPECIES: DNA-formamidopyrimidine glycosylase family protein [unclassified Ornithinimicrobium]
MPEGDAVWRTARRLHTELVGQVLQGSDLRVPELATRDLSGRRTIEVVPRGKHLLHRLEGGLTLHSHLRMDGSWKVQGSGARYAAGRRHTTRALLWTAHRVAVGDRLGMLDLVRTRDEDQVVGHLGPDLLDPGFEVAQAVANLMEQPLVPVAEALLDQRNLAGIGTIWASEPLFLHRINPWDPVGKVGAKALGELLVATRTLMVQACRVGRPATTGRTGAGEETWVFGRRGRRCHRCGATVEQGSVGRAPQARVFSYCQGCQGAPADA